LKTLFIGIGFIILAVFIAIHQFIFYNVWFEFEDLHHETVMILFAGIGITVLWLKKG